MNIKNSSIFYISLLVLFVLNLAFGIGDIYASTLENILMEAEAGSPEAQADLGWAYLSGEGVEQDFNKSLHWYTKAAEQGDPTAQTGLGYLYENGKGVKRDYTKAFFWYQKAANQNFAKGQRPLGVMYERGRGVEKDFQKAAFWYRKAAEQGLARAQVNLGDLYEKGLGVEEDAKQAAYWYKQSTLKNYARGQTKLGLLYENGRGVEKDIHKAKFWYSKASSQGYTQATEHLRRLEKETPQTASQLAPLQIDTPLSPAGASTSKPDKQTVQKEETILYVNEDTVLVKKDPATPPPFIIKIGKGTKVLEKKRQGDWIEVIVEETGRSGWILSSQTEEISQKESTQ